MKLVCYYSPSYFAKVTHSDQSGKEEYFLDSVIKPKWVYEQLKNKNYLNIVVPSVIEESDLLKIHSERYIKAVQTGDPIALAQSSGLRWTPSLYQASLMTTSGFFRALETALEEKFACSLSTSFHHAQKENGGGFCVFNGMAITALKALSELNLKKLAVIDCDYHYADGIMNLLANHPQIDIYDIYGGMHSKFTNLIHANNIKNYFVRDSEDYDKALKEMFEVIATQKYDAILYDAGMDIWIKDRIGGILGMDEKEIGMRDKKVFEFAQSQDIPVAFMLGGGYVNFRNEDGAIADTEIVKERQNNLAKLHVNTIKIAYQVANSS